ncbi:MAG: AAA family ATPase [Deltaproteobacteria bacterium]|nr:AAA family ATPase [Deltaproteobacteria bacterium]
MIERFRAENYGCLKNVEVKLTPIHAFVGPNDSGKSTLLHAIRTVCQLAGDKFTLDPKRRIAPFDPHLPWGAHFTLTASGTDWSYSVYPTPRSIDRLTDRPIGQPPTLQEDLRCKIGQSGHMNREPFAASEVLGGANRVQPPAERLAIMHQMSPGRLLRLDAAALREPSSLVPPSHFLDIAFGDERGLGLAGVLHAVRERDPEAFATIVRRVRDLFPAVATISLPAASASTLTIEAELTDRVRVAAEQLSDGLLYYLAFAALRSLSPPAVLLLEEPENGLHPARIAEVVRVLRNLVESAPTQVLIATHSPLVINELNPEEVTVLTRSSVEEGTKARPIKDTPNFEKRAGVYALGELWLAYCDGKDESPLFDEARR